MTYHCYSTTSKDYESNGKKTEKLANICKQAGATHYITGPSAMNYLNEETFSMNNIETWDSLNHLKLMILLQKTFKINLNSNQIATATDEKKIFAIVTKKIYQK